MKDRRGVEIKVGDIAVHASSGRYGAYDVVRVAGFTPQRVKVDMIDYMTNGRPSPAEVLNLHPSTLIVATLPHVENRLNNQEPSIA